MEIRGKLTKSQILRFSAEKVKKTRIFHYLAIFGNMSSKAQKSRKLGVFLNLSDFDEIHKKNLRLPSATKFVFIRQRMLQFLVGILKIRNVIESMEWSLHYLNCLIQRRRPSIATTLPLVTTTQTSSWFSRCLCLCRSREILQLYPFHLTTII